MTTRCEDCPMGANEYKYICNEQSCLIATNRKKYSTVQTAIMDGSWSVHPAVRSMARVMMSLPYMGDKAKTYAYAQAIATALTKEK